MMQEIASKDGNFCGVCPVIGRLNCFCFRCVYRWDRGRSALRRPFFLARNDTHDGVDRLCGDQSPTGSRTLLSANAAQNILIIHEVLPAMLLLALTHSRARELRSTFQLGFFEGFRVRTTKLCLLQGEEDKCESAKKDS